MGKIKLNPFRRFYAEISVSTYIIGVTLFFMAVYHLPFFSFVLSHLDIGSKSGIGIFFSVFLALFVVTSVLFYLFSLLSVRFLKWMTLLFMLTNALAVYFVLTYHVILDKTMMGNVWNTHTAESLSYYQPKIFLYLFFLGIIPAFIASRFKVLAEKRLVLLGKGLAILAVGVLIMYLNASTWLWLDKYAKRLGALAMPWSYTINAIRYKAKELKKAKKQIPLPSLSFKNDDKTIVVLVIGESARAKNFSLYGYKKETNPLLPSMNVTALPAKSTATYTTASVHSMLSYTGGTSDDYEVLPNYLQRGGAYVTWRTSNWGEPKLKVAAYKRAKDLKGMCQGEGCDYDEVLLSGLEEEISHVTQNKVFIVLHTAGSHGPSYYKKYPQSFEKFTPVCRSVDIQKCSKEEIENAYDNTIVYTDYVLSKVIAFLQKQHTSSLMLYASDHGESLGEKGFYLHGTPYAIAPDEQKNIPFIVWASKDFMKDKHLAKEEAEMYSQQYIFHTILGAFGVKSEIYDQTFDLFSHR